MKKKKASAPDRKEILKSEIAKLRNELVTIEQAEAQEIATPLYRRCFKTRNSYGSSYPDWWIYCRVIAIEGSWLTVVSFQTDCHGRLDYNPKEQYSLGHLTGFEEISEGELQAAFEVFRRKVVMP